MKTTLFAACAIAGLIAAPALAQISAGVGVKAMAAPPAAAASPSMPSMSMPQTAMPQSSMPQTSMPQTSVPQTSVPSSKMPSTSMPTTSPATDPAATAATGTATNTAAMASDLKMGAAVTDTTGAELGTISKVTKGKTDAETMVTLKANGKTKTVPASSLGLSGGALVSSRSKADIWGPM
jgi:hypothetical protein